MKRSGSALLVVLGVLSFLVVSAVSFAAFMRRSRLPSSYLRRTVAARQLAKAAVVRATHAIDYAIGNNVHPGIGGNTANTWNDRVFFNGGSEQSIRQTTSVLTMEGLAYIPPPLVNEARYWARKSPTAVWQAFGYDVGRYAYLALDVSDYFDVNRLVADYPRSSAANRRVTIAHLFEDVNHQSAPSGADEWDEFMDAFRTIDEETLEIKFDEGSKIPLVSVADFNLALADQGSIGTMKSPFKDYLQQGSFYADNSGAALEKYGEMTFVTDGWYPRSETRTTTTGGSNSQTEIYDLANGDYQPFSMSMLQKNKTKLSLAVLGTGMNNEGGARDIWLERLSGLGCAALADYLDVDRTPISLAVPTTERVPMICGLSPQLGKSLFKISKTGDSGDPIVKSEESKLARQVEQTVMWKIDAAEFKKAFEMGRVQTLALYPFLHKEDNEPNFEIDGQFSLFFSSGDARLRTSANDVLHLSQNTIQNSAIDSGNGVMRIKLPAGRPAMKTLTTGKAEAEEDALWDSQVSFMLSEGSGLAAEMSNAGKEFLKIVYTWNQTRKSEEDPTWTPSIQEIMSRDVSSDSTVQVVATCGLPALTADGIVDEDFTTRLQQNVKNPNWSKTIRLNAAVWMRVLNKDDGKVVDMVPACIKDDLIQNSVNDPDERVQIIGQDEFAGKPYPIMRFSTGVSLDFGVQSLIRFAEENSAGIDMEITPKAVMVADPRFNYAPEHWFKSEKSELKPTDWIEENCYGDGTHDTDFFLATSDAGYMQSIYELAFLPRFTDLNSYGASVAAGNLQPPGSGNLTEFPAKGSERNRDLMWTSYSPFLSSIASEYEKLPFSSEGNGMKVNPYSNSTNVLMAAFANTPLDWRRASTNVMEDATDYASMDVKSFNSKYAWNEYSSGGRFAWADLRGVAGEFMNRVRSSGNSGWVHAWNDMDWLDSESGGFLGYEFEGDTDDLWSVDRKFFYGFWRDCFAAKQQLFLVFVRAEPLMLGGGAADEMPSQLGARAVALVWRDAENPTVSGEGSNASPHRTRLLFYRPLE